MLKLMNYIFGIVLVLLGISQVLGTYTSLVGRKASDYTIPVLVTIIGILFLCNIMSANVITVIFGICLIFAAIRDFMYVMSLNKAKKIQLAESERAAERIRRQQSAEDAEIISDDTGK